MALSLQDASRPSSGSNTDALLLVAPESCAAYESVARRLSRDTGVNASVLPLGTHAHTALAAVLSRTPASAVIVPLTVGASDPMVTELGGLLRWARARWPDVPVLESASFGATEHLVGWAAQQVRRAQVGLPDPGPPQQTAVILVGAGGASPAANADVCAIARLLCEHGDFAVVETAFVQEREGRPSIAMRIEQCRRLGVRRVVVVPVALLDGPTVREVRARAEAALDADSVMDIAVAGPLLSPGGAAAVVRERYRDAMSRWLATGEDGPSRQRGHDHAMESPFAADDLLPPRYRGGQPVSAAPMRSAGLRYDRDGNVAWNEVWQSFCNLALAGGPPHRGSLLEPALREEALGDPEGYARVVAEIARGLSLITRLPVVTDAAPGWVGLECEGGRPLPVLPGRFPILREHGRPLSPDWQRSASIDGIRDRFLRTRGARDWAQTLVAAVPDARSMISGIPGRQSVRLGGCLLLRAGGLPLRVQTGR